MNQRTGAASPKNGPSSNHSSNGNTPQRPGKELRMLALFAAGHSLNRFQAEKYGDHVLPTTVSDLQKRFELEFSRASEKVPTSYGKPTKATRYWLEGEHLDRARRALKREALSHHQTQIQPPVIGRPDL